MISFWHLVEVILTLGRGHFDIWLFPLLWFIIESMPQYKDILSSSNMSLLISENIVFLVRFCPKNFLRFSLFFFVFFTLKTWKKLTYNIRKYQLFYFVLECFIQGFIKALNLVFIRATVQPFFLFWLHL